MFTEQMSDLLEAARKRDREAFQRLFEPYRPELRLHCYRMLGTIDDAEDLVQETFLRAWRAVDRFEGRASVRSWLYRIATNTCLNALASQTAARRFMPDAVGPPAVVAADLSVDRRPDHRVHELDRVLAPQKLGTHEDADGPSRRLPIQAG